MNFLKNQSRGTTDELRLVRAQHTCTYQLLSNHHHFNIGLEEHLVTLQNSFHMDAYEYQSTSNCFLPFVKRRRSNFSHEHSNVFTANTTSPINERKNDWYRVCININL